jgi:hypothetical protein
LIARGKFLGVVSILSKHFFWVPKLSLWSAYTLFGKWKFLFKEVWLVLSRSLKKSCGGRKGRAPEVLPAGVVVSQ